MTAPTSLIDSLADHVDRLGARPDATRAARRWAALDPVLRPYPTPAAIATAARNAGPELRDRLLTSLLRADAAAGIGRADDWAGLTALAILAPRLAWIVRTWARAGVTGADLADAEADLVAECWAQIRTVTNQPPPDRPGLVLVDRAWTRVRDRRVTDRRRAARLTPAPVAEPTGDPAAVEAVAHGDQRTGPELLAAAIADARRDGSLPAGPARALFLTRVAGLPTVDAARALATTPASVRMLRSRAATRLTATARTTRWAA